VAGSTLMSGSGGKVDRNERFGSASRVIQVGFWVNAGLMTMKLLAGHFGRSEAVFADGMESAADFIAILSSMIALRIGSQPYDEAHPYGHGKAESISAIIVSLSSSEPADGSFSGPCTPS
jgi:divalent metal cation (Fe/Co/Zn/Cd) transporter